MEKEILQLKKVTPPLLSWYEANRRCLPWREEVSAYRTWVSEIMLQQTRVAAVLPYFARFMEAFPTVEALAEAEPERLMKLWEGLGYYSRARNLQKTAHIVTERYNGQFPHTYRELMELPGIGDYTAGAILSIAFGQAEPAVDGNVLRLVARITGSRLDVTDPKNRMIFRGWVAEAMPINRAGAYNQAWMDLGATVCLPNGAPLCQQCPLQEHCCACREGSQKILPVRAPKKTKRVEEKTVFLLSRRGQIALRQRPREGLLAGLWEYPHVESLLEEPGVERQLEQWGITPRNWYRKISARHVFTHIIWQMNGYVLEVEGEGPDGWIWAGKEERALRAIPSAFEKFTEAIPVEEEL